MNEKKTGHICVPVCEGRAVDLRGALERACLVADVVELRLDYLQGDELFKALSNLPSLISASARPVIVTLRPVGQGGRREMDNLTRLIFWVEHFLYGKPHVDFADIELDLALVFMEKEREENREILNWGRVICSHHDFKGVPEDLEKIYEQMAATPARILKLAVTAADVTDCIPVLRLLERARREGRDFIAVAMGSPGAVTRVLGPSRGGFLTYGSSDASHASAPGQVSAAELRELYRVNQLDRQTQIMGLMGSPVAHSLSPHLHNAAFAAAGLNAVYVPFDVGDAAGFLRRMAHPRTREIEWNLRGLSVTTPHKTAVMERLDGVEEPAREIGAVNTIVVGADGLRGYNTDAAALILPLAEKGLRLDGARCAILGAGGAARAALWGLGRAGARLTLFARDPSKAAPVAEKFGAACAQLEGASFEGFDLVVNATPLGTRGRHEEETPASTRQLRGARLAYDLVYNPPETRFLREARAAGCDALGGLSMLVAQAAEQFRLWTGRAAPADIMLKAAADKLDEQAAEGGGAV